MAADPRTFALACALRVEKDHGADAPRFVAERIGALALAGDVDGIRMWKAIASQLDRLAGRDPASAAH